MKLFGIHVPFTKKEPARCPECNLPKERPTWRIVCPNEFHGCTGSFKTCQVYECSGCAKECCAYEAPEHFWHDGCPTCPCWCSYKGCAHPWHNMTNAEQQLHIRVAKHPERCAWLCQAGKHDDSNTWCGWWNLLNQERCYQCGSTAPEEAINESMLETQEEC